MPCDSAPHNAVPCDGGTGVAEQDSKTTGTSSETKQEAQALSPEARAAKLEELDAKITKFEGQRRWVDVIRTMLAKVDLLEDVGDKLPLMIAAGSLYLERSNNQAEAIKCFERVLEFEEQNTEALHQLKALYEKRRDWVRMLGIMEREADLLPVDRQLERFAEMAQIAMERVRKPDVCAQLWKRVVDLDPQNAHALNNLAQLYERGRQWDPLAQVLEELIDQASSDEVAKPLLQKLGMVYADKLEDDAKAIESFQRLLELDPDDRRAQEQLKRRFIAIKGWDQLQDFLESSEKHDELIRIFEREAENPQCDSETEKVELLTRAAKLWEAKKQRPERAVRLYERVREIDKDNRDAALALAEVYAQAKDYAKLVEVLDVQQRGESNFKQRVGVLADIAEIAEVQLNDLPRAFSAWAEAFNAEPHNAEIQRQLMRVAGITNSWKEALAAVDRQIASRDEPSEVQLLLVRARFMGAAGRVEEAIDEFLRVDGLEPDSIEVFDGLDTLYRAAKRYDDLLKLYDQRLEGSVDDDFRRRLSYARGALLEDPLGRTQDAIDAYLAIVGEFGDQTEAYVALDRLYEQGERWAPLAETIDKQIELSEDTEQRTALRLRLGMLFENRLAEPIRALELFEEVLRDNEANAEAIAGLERLTALDDVGVDAARILEPVFTNLGQWGKVVDMLLVLAARNDNPLERLSLWTRIADTRSEALGDELGAFEALGQALRQMPDDEGTLRRLEIMAGEQNQTRALQGLLEELARENVADADCAAALWMRAAEIAETELRDNSKAIEAYRQVPPLGSEQTGAAYRALELLYTQTEAWRELVDVLKQRVELCTDEDEAETLLLRIASLYEEMLADSAQAIRTYRELTERNPDSTQALKALDALFEREKMWSDLADNIDRQLELAESLDAQVALMLRLAEIHRHRLGAVDAAVEIYREILERDPANAAVLAELESLLEQPGQTRRTVSAILEPLYVDLESHDKLARLYEVEIADAESPERRVELLSRLGELHEMSRDDLPSAFGAYERAINEDPGDLSAVERLEHIGRQLNDAQRVAQVYRGLIAKLEDPSLLVMFRMRTAEFLEVELNEAEGAIEQYQAILKVEPTHIESIAALERLYQSLERFSDLAATLVSKSRISNSLDEQKELLLRAGSLYEDVLNQPDAAVDVYKQLLEADSEEVAAVDKMIDLYMRLERWPDLLEAYRRRADLALNPDEKKAIWVNIAAVYESELGDVDQSVATYQHILEFDPDERTALARLATLFESAGSWRELLGVLEREAELAEHPEELVGYRLRVARILQDKLGNASEAIDVYREVLEVAPGNEQSIQALVALVESRREAVKASTVLDDVFRHMEAWEPLAKNLLVREGFETEGYRKVELLREAGEIYEQHVGDLEEALRVFLRALDHEPTNEDLQRSLEELAHRTGKWSDVAKGYRAQLSKLDTKDDPGIQELALRLARIDEEQLGDAEAAARHLEGVLAADPDNVDAIYSLDRLYTSLAAWEKLAELLKKEIELAASDEERVSLSYRLGEIYEGHLELPGKALDAFRAVLELDPHHPAAIASLESLFADGFEPARVGEALEGPYRMQERWDGVIRVLEARVPVLEDRETKRDILREIAELSEETQGDLQRALGWTLEGVRLDPSDDSFVMEAERLAGMTDHWTTLAHAYADVLETEQRSEVLRVMARRLARLYEEELGDLQRAEKIYRYALGLDAQATDILDALDRIYDTYGAHHSLANVLRKRLDIADDPVLAAEFSFRLGQVLQYDLRRPSEAAACYEQLLRDRDPENHKAVAELQRIYLANKDWSGLLRSFDFELTAAPSDDERGLIYARMARLCEEHLNDDAKAIEFWKKSLEMRGEDPEALNALGDIYARQEQWTELAEVLDREVCVEERDAVRVTIFGDLGRLNLRQLGRERDAIDSWERALDLDPAHTLSLFHIAAAYKSSGQQHQLIETLQRYATTPRPSGEDKLVAKTYVHLGSMYARELEQPDAAIECYRHAVEFDPEDTTALESLEVMHRREQNWFEVADAMERRAAVATAPEQCLMLHLAAGDLWESRVEDGARAVHAYQEVLGLAPLHRHAFNQLETLLSKSAEWEPLVEVYLNRAEVCERVKDRIRLLRRIAQVYEEHLDDASKAFDAMLVAWSEDYTDRATVRHLERVTAASQRWNDLLDHANNALPEAKEPAVKNAICLDCARWYGQELGHPEYAIPYYQQILAIDPQNVRAMRQMAELYRITHQWQTMAQILTRIVEMTDDPEEKAEIYVSLGDLCENHLGATKKGIEHYQTAHQYHPHNLAALQALERVYREQEKWRELLGILRHRSDALQGEPEEVEARLSYAYALEEHAETFDDAIAMYERVVELDSQNVAALGRLEVLYEHLENWRPLARVLEAQIDVAASEKEKLDIHSRLALLLEREFMQVDLAIEHFERALTIDPARIEVLENLERLLRQQQRWDSLIEVLERRVAVAATREEGAEVYKRIGAIEMQERKDIDRAVDAYLSVVSVNPQDAEAQDKLAQLYELRDDYGASYESLMVLVSASEGDPEKQVELLLRVGTLLEEKMGDRAEALECLQRGLDLAPNHLGLLASVRRIHVASEDWLAAASILAREADEQTSDRVASQRLVELGRIYADKLDEAEHAFAAFEQAIQRDPENEEAAEPLAYALRDQGRYEEALPLVELLVHRAGKRSQDEQHAIYQLHGEVTYALGQFERAAEAYAKAHQLDASNIQSLIGLSRAHFHAKHWDKSFKFFQLLLVHQREELNSEEVADVFYHLGKIKLNQGEKRKAINMFDKALEESTHHRETIKALSEVYAAQNDWEQLVNLKLKLAEVADADEHFLLLMEVGDIWQEKLRKTSKAVDYYREASEERPDDHRVLHKLLESYQQTRQWDDAIDIIERISDVEERAEVKAKYAYTIGVIFRDEIKQSDEALARFGQALDLDYKQLKPFEAINKILTQRKDWKQLEREFRKMIHRSMGSGDTQLGYNLWHNLGVIYRDRLRNYESAAESFEMAKRVHPSDPMAHRILAELYASVPGKSKHAIAEQQWLLNHDPNNLQPYRELYRLYFESSQYDKAWCVAATLNFLRKADREHQEFYTQFKKEGVIRPKNRLDNEGWVRFLLHEKEDLYVSKIMEILAGPFYQLRAADDRALGLQKKHEVDPSESTITVARTFGFAAQVLALPATPRLFLVPEAPGGLAHVTGSSPPASVCGAGLLSGRTPQDLAFLVGHHLAYYRGEHFMRLMLSSAAELKTMLLAGLRLGEVGPNLPEVEQTAHTLAQQMTAAQMESLRTVAKKLVAEEHQTDIKEWIRGVEFGACRAGFLCCNDLETASRMIKETSSDASVEVPPGDKLRELIVFSVSESYFALRRALGVEVQV